MFIHDALNEFITCGETDIAAENLQLAINKLSRPADGKEISGFQNQFEVRRGLSENSSNILNLTVSLDFGAVFSQDE